MWQVRGGKKPPRPETGVSSNSAPRCESSKRGFLDPPHPGARIQNEDETRYERKHQGLQSQCFEIPVTRMSNMQN